MKFYLIIFLVAALLRRISAECSTDCSSDFKGKLLCGVLNGCYLDMEYCSLLAFNCARLYQSRPLFNILREGSCGADKLPKCDYMDF